MLSIVIDTSDLEKMGQFWSIFWPDMALLDTVEALAEDAKQRLERDDTAPDGSRWEPWSDNPPGYGYASRRPPGTKLLRDSRDLLRSIEGTRQAGEYIVGSDEPYAQVHQFGSRDGRVPQRQYAGMSDDLETALDGIYTAAFERGFARLR